ncbi:nitric oxide-associated protein 1 [Belonocnema kinseyi]|uniref:nitric oxide-associated protein 1 n=1 Tax=Belonocnema kinseyi TaxID=2817044 RepID=UPI00143DA354|nr:nitric oxide-associated protein 1 [Belonocnema kinseyi]
MLNARRMLYTVVKHSTDLTYSKMLRRYKVRLCFSQIIGFQSRLEFSTIHKLINLNEKVLESKKIDPRVQKWEDKLLYSDYVLTKSLKFGYKLNRRIEVQMERKIALRRKQELMSAPALSIAAKYLIDDQEPSKDKYENSKAEVKEEAPKPIYMPYAARDAFKSVNVTETPEVEDEPILNEKFKVLYEKYLEAMQNPENESQENKDKLQVRLGDDLSKVPPTWMTDYETFDDIFEEESWEARYGTPDPDSKVSSIPCGGCGALLHCKDSEIPGYLPSELFKGQRNDVLQSLICQRCHFMKYYNTSLDVKVSPEEYPKLLGVIKEKKCAVILMVDLTDFPGSIWPDISSLIGRRTPVFVVGNKVDLLPQDSPRFLDHVNQSLLNAICETGIKQKNIKHVGLVSAKSGYGVEELINKLQNLWKYRGDVYLIGCTNVGKSSLFNALIQSDYCKVQAVDLMQRATTSPWPGTTLNLLKFPITNPSPWRLFERTQRLQAERKSNVAEQRLRVHQLNVSRNIQYATLQGRIGRTFKVPRKRGVREDFSVGSHKLMTGKKFGVDENSDYFKFGRWCYDTPGTVQADQILHLLTTDELMKTLPKTIISPRTFLLHRGQTIFLAGMGRLDCLNVPSFLRITVFSSKELPITICETIWADEIYRELLETEAFGVPINNPERLKLWPELQSKDMEVLGLYEDESAADVILSSAGWMAITALQGEQVSLRAWTPEGRGLFLRTPALLRKSVTLRGVRIRNSPAYKSGKRVYTKPVHF